MRLIRIYQACGSYTQWCTVPTPPDIALRRAEASPPTMRQAISYDRIASSRGLIRYLEPMDPLEQQQPVPASPTTGSAGMSQDAIRTLVTELPGVVMIIGSQEGGQPEIAWGDTFFFYDPDNSPKSRRIPFATIIVKDYDGWDTISELNRPGVFRLNIAVGRTVYEQLIGYPPAEHEYHADRFDYAATDKILPHPVHSIRGWVCIVNPGEATAEQARSLLVGAHARASRGRRSVGHNQSSEE